ncbi:MAG: hypothetical protein QXR48_00540 [Candidatus Woesearchaeota archaeon]
MVIKTVAALFLFIVLLLPFVGAIDEGAEWFPTVVSYSWDWSMGGVCSNETQCLLHLLGNESYDGDVERWFRMDDVRQWPRCINDSQNILDYLCENGNWTTRTKYLAIQMIRIAEEISPTNFTLFCDSYERVLNKYQYSLAFGIGEYLGSNCEFKGKIIPCVNSICVLRSPQTVAVGTTLNIPVNDPSHSFLLALEKSYQACNGVSPALSVFQRCGGEPVWYNPRLNAVIYLPLGSALPPTSETPLKITLPVLRMSNYVMDVLHKPENPGMFFAYFPRTRLFNHLYVAQNGENSIFGFLEANLRPEYTMMGENITSPIPLDYIGVRYSPGIKIDDSHNLTCLNLIKKYDTNAFCENQTDTGFNVIARHRCPDGADISDCPYTSSPIVGVWPALTGKLRP